jgi:hypothetical protein
MKSIIVVLFLLPFFGFAQDSCQLKKDTDPFTHQTRISTGFVSFKNGGLDVSISIDATPADIDFFIWIKSDKCFNDESTVQVNYEGDRLKANFKNTGSMNCEGAFHFNFRNVVNTPSNLQKLTTKKINSLHIVGDNKTVTDITFTEEQKAQLMRMAACVVRDSKTLIKQ